jgi:hypothetical protein
MPAFPHLHFLAFAVDINREVGDCELEVAVPGHEESHLLAECERLHINNEHEGA